MATCDPDGSRLLAAQDRLACLHMELGEWAIELKQQVEDLVGPDFHPFV